MCADERRPDKGSEMGAVDSAENPRARGPCHFGDPRAEGGSETQPYFFTSGLFRGRTRG